MRLRFTWMFKIITAVLMWSAYFLSYKIYYPILTNKIATSQLANTDTAFINYQLYQSAWKFGFVLLIIITFLIFIRNFKEIFIAGKNKIAKK